MQIKVIFHKNGFALRPALKQRHKRTRKWSILSVGGIVFGGQKFTRGPAVRVFNKFFFHSRYLQNGTAVLDNSLAFLVKHSVKVALIAEE